MKYQRIYLEKSEITHPDNLRTPIKFVDGSFDRRGDKRFDAVTLKIISKRTGNVSREIDALPVEIRGIFGIYRMILSEKMIRKRERIFNLHTKEEYNAIPICRTAWKGYVIYKLISI